MKFGSLIKYSAVVAAAVCAGLFLTPANPASAETQTKVDPEFAHYLLLRKAALKISREQLPIPSSDTRDPYGVAMEMSYPESLVTLFILSGGTAELYLSGGGEVSGGEQAKNVRATADKMIDIAGRFSNSIPAAARTPLPDKGQVRFYLLTRAGLRSKQVSEQKLAGGKDPLSPLYFAGHAVIASLRNTEASAEKKGMKKETAGSEDESGAAARSE